MLLILTFQDVSDTDHRFNTVYYRKNIFYNSVVVDMRTILDYHQSGEKL